MTVRALHLRAASAPAHIAGYNLAGPRGATGADGDTAPVVTAEITSAIEAHAAAPEPHTAYDDMPDLSILFTNATT